MDFLDEVVDELMSKPIMNMDTSTLREYNKLLSQYTKHKFRNLGRSRENRNFNPLYNRHKDFVNKRKNYDRYTRKQLIEEYRHFRQLYNTKWKNTKEFSSFRRNMVKRLGGKSTMTGIYNKINEELSNPMKQELVDFAKEHNIELDTLNEALETFEKYGLSQLDFERIYWGLYSTFMEESGYTEVLRNKGSDKVQQYLMEQLKDPSMSFNNLHNIMLEKIINVYKEGNSPDISVWK